MKVETVMTFVFVALLLYAAGDFPYGQGVLAGLTFTLVAMIGRLAQRLKDVEQKLLIFEKTGRGRGPTH